MTKPMGKKLDDAEIVRILEDMLERSDSGQALADNREAALNYFYCRPRGDEVAGRSQVQSADVADMHSALMAGILPSFTGDRICEFEPDGPGDDAQARLETDATNRALMESDRGYVQLHAALSDALLLKAGIIKGWVDEERGYKGKKVRRLRIEAVDPTCFGVSPDQQSPILTDCKFCWELKVYTRGELKALGFDVEKISEIPSRETQGTTDANARSRKRLLMPEVNAGWATEQVDIHEIHAELDCEGTGEAELYRFLKGHKTLLLKEPAEFLPYASGAAWLEPHSFWGLSVYDKVKSVQDIKTAVMRQAIDNLTNCNFSRVIVNERVNVDDLLAPRAGGVVRVDSSAPVQDCAMPLPPIDTSAGSQSLLALMDKVRSERAGASLDLQHTDSQILKSQAGADNIGTILGNAEMQAGMVARNLAETLIRSTFMLVHRLLRTDYGQPLNLRLADTWVTQDPSKWPPRDRVNIKAGLSPAERKQKAGNLAAIMQGQVQMAQMGMDGVLVGPDNLYSAFMDWAAASEIDAPEKYITNPDSEKGKQAGAMKTQQAQGMQQMQAQMAQQQQQLEAMKLQLDKAKSDNELKFKYWEARLNAETKEAELIGTATADLNRVEAEGRNEAARAERERATAAPSGQGQRAA